MGHDWRSWIAGRLPAFKDCILCPWLLFLSLCFLVTKRCPAFLCCALLPSCSASAQAQNNKVVQPWTEPLKPWAQNKLYSWSWSSWVFWSQWCKDDNTYIYAWLVDLKCANIAKDNQLKASKVNLILGYFRPILNHQFEHSRRNFFIGVCLSF